MVPDFMQDGPSAAMAGLQEDTENAEKLNRRAFNSLLLV
jgi:hypothetical protein